METFHEDLKMMKTMMVMMMITVTMGIKKSWRYPDWMTDGSGRSRQISKQEKKGRKCTYDKKYS